MIPKFRLFDVETNQMKEVMFLDLLRKTAWFDADEEAIGYDFETCKLMQSTGLYDANGKEIFEGDVLKSPYGFIGKVNIVEGAWYVQHNDFTNNHFLYVAQGKSEIIGNIHEHPELLEEDDE